MFRFTRAVFAFAAGLLLANFANAGELRILHSSHYRIHTDLDRALAEDLAGRMDAMYEEYTRRLSSFDVDRSGRKFDVYLLAKRDEYLKFTHGRTNNSAGITIPELNVVAAFLEGEGRDELRCTLQHEAFHQFASSVIHSDLPPWTNEGLAVVFQEGIWTGQQFLIGQVPPRRVRQLQHDIETSRLIDFKEMMSMTLPQWNQRLERDKQMGAVQYNQAWAMCQFLVYAAEQGKPKYRARFLDMLQRIRNNATPLDAFKSAFSNNIEGFQARFVDWSKNLQPTRDATLIERQNIVAEMLIDYSNHGVRFNDLPDFRDRVVRSGMWLEYTLGDMKWSTDRDPRIYFRTPDGRPYDGDELYLEPRSGAALPDLVCRPVGQLKMRTHFHDLPGGKIEAETVVEN